MQSSYYVNNNAASKKIRMPFNLSGIAVLVAEDNQVNQLVISRILEKWNASVQMADNGDVAVKEAMQKYYQLILMDLDMPVMDGYEAAALLKTAILNCPSLH
jgi:CheY-like chemotaxis protein